MAPNLYYIYYYAHRFNLVLIDAISNILDLKEFFVIQILYNFTCNSKKMSVVHQMLKRTWIPDYFKSMQHSLVLLVSFSHEVSKYIWSYCYAFGFNFKFSHWSICWNYRLKGTKLQSHIYIVYLYKLENILCLAHTIRKHEFVKSYKTYIYLLGDMS